VNENALSRFSLLCALNIDTMFMHKENIQYGIQDDIFIAFAVFMNTIGFVKYTILYKIIYTMASGFVRPCSMIANIVPAEHKLHHLKVIKNSCTLHNLNCYSLHTHRTVWGHGGWNLLSVQILPKGGTNIEGTHVGVESCRCRLVHVHKPTETLARLPYFLWTSYVHQTEIFLKQVPWVWKAKVWRLQDGQCHWPVNVQKSWNYDYRFTLKGKKNKNYTILKDCCLKQKELWNTVCKTNSNSQFAGKWWDISNRWDTRKKLLGPRLVRTLTLIRMTKDEKGRSPPSPRGGQKRDCVMSQCASQ